MKEPINYSLRWFLGAVANFIRALARILVSRVEGKNLRCQLAASQGCGRGIMLATKLASC